ncbi:hypothetical protein BV20DRAFT_441907 [Pilatotrama ljubarskyi]|nr:hypothetical protein BV20DRAFT_441907 [Pilatotrama ljubarskyi]
MEADTNHLLDSDHLPLQRLLDNEGTQCLLAPRVRAERLVIPWSEQENGGSLRNSAREQGEHAPSTEGCRQPSYSIAIGIKRSLLRMPVRVWAFGILSYSRNERRRPCRGQEQRAHPSRTLCLLYSSRARRMLGTHRERSDSQSNEKQRSSQINQRSVFHPPIQRLRATRLTIQCSGVIAGSFGPPVGRHRPRRHDQTLCKTGWGSPKTVHDGAI